MDYLLKKLLQNNLIFEKMRLLKIKIGQLIVMINCGIYTLFFYSKKYHTLAYIK
jgi:hypothetical protein